MRCIFISHPFASAPDRHARVVTELAGTLAHCGFLPLAPQIYLPRFIDEATERDLALRLCLKLVGISDELRVYGCLSDGMRLEVAEARRLCIPVVAGDDDAKIALTGEPPPIRTRGRLGGGVT